MREISRNGAVGVGGALVEEVGVGFKVLNAQARPSVTFSFCCLRTQM